MKKIIGIAMVFFLLMGCAHSPQKIPGDMTPTHGDGSPDIKPDKAKQTKFWGPREKALLGVLVIAVLIAAFVYGAKKSMDDLGEFNFNALYP
jgi:hypothetical protein